MIEVASEQFDDPNDTTCHYCEKDGSGRGGLITWPSGLACCEVCFEEFSDRDAEAFEAPAPRRNLNRFTRQRKPSANYYRRKGRRSALRSLLSADSDDDDDDSGCCSDSGSDALLTSSSVYIRWHRTFQRSITHTALFLEARYGSFPQRPPHRGSIWEPLASCASHPRSPVALVICK